MAEQRRTLNVVTLSVEDDKEILEYLGFRDQDTNNHEDGAAECEVVHGGYRAEALFDGHGHIVAQIGPASPKGMNGIRADVTLEIRNGHSLATENITVNPPEKWVVSSATIKGRTYEFPDGDIVQAAMSAIRKSTTHLQAQQSQFREASRMAKARQQRPGPR